MDSDKVKFSPSIESLISRPHVLHHVYWSVHKCTKHTGGHGHETTKKVSRVNKTHDIDSTMLVQKCYSSLSPTTNQDVPTSSSSGPKPKQR